MLKNEDIICIGFPKWEGEYLKSTVQLMSELARFNRVLYVDYHYTLSDTIRGIRKKRPAPVRKILGADNRLQQRGLENGASVALLTLPPAIPSNWTSHASIYDAIARLNTAIALPFIRRAMRQLGFDRPVVINAFQPTLGLGLVGKLHEKILLYYCYDEISAAPWVKKHGPRMEGRFLSRADAVITSSEHLQQVKERYNSECFVVKNGVDYKLFSREDIPAAPAALSGNYRQTVGYLGSVDSRLDFALLVEVIQKLPDYQFVFAGRVTDPGGAALLRQFPNVRLLGPKPPAELPAILEHFDIGIIPFVKNKLTAAIYPLKINEYLARGKAVVSTGFARLDEFQSIIRVADGAAAFAVAIQESCQRSLLEEVQNRKAIAKSNSWEMRAREFGEVIETLL